MQPISDAIKDPPVVPRGARAHSAPAFTLIELLVVIAIIGLLASVIVVNLSSTREDAYVARAQAEFNSFRTALELYRADQEVDTYPDDVGRGIPAGLEQYLASDGWPDAPWPKGIYDWDNWEASDLAYAPYEHTVQLSIRFCDGGPSTCQFPAQDWADDFGVNSAAYFCIEGPCRAHSNQKFDYPAYCLNCGSNE